MDANFGLSFLCGCHYLDSATVIACWWRSVVARRRSSHERSYPTAGPVSTWMSDHLWAGIPLRYVTSQLG